MNVLNKLLSNLRQSVNITMGNTASQANESVDNGFTRGTYGDVKNTVRMQFYAVKILTDDHLNIMFRRLHHFEYVY